MAGVVSSSGNTCGIAVMLSVLFGVDRCWRGSGVIIDDEHTNEICYYVKTLL